jgi:hypothetical protein
VIKLSLDETSILNHADALQRFPAQSLCDKATVFDCASLSITTPQQRTTEFRQERQPARLCHLAAEGTAMTVKVDSVEPNIFPAVEHLDARDAGRNVEVIFEVRIEGKSTPVTVKLGYEQAATLADLLEPFRKT